MTALLLTMVLAQAGSPCSAKAAVEDTSQVCATLAKGKEATAVLNVVELSPDYQYRAALSWGWDATAAAPKAPVRIIKSLHVTLGGKEIEVPLSASRWRGH